MKGRTNITKALNKLTAALTTCLTRLHDLILRGNLVLGRFFRFVWCRLLRLASIELRTLFLLVNLPFRFLLWILLHPVFQAFLALGTLVSVVYLVYDNYYQREMTISSPASDPMNPFYFPFSVVNNSHVFTMRDVKWTCTIDYLVNDKYMAVMDSHTGGSGFQAILRPNDILNIDCSGYQVAPPVMEAKISIALSYKTSVLGLPLPETTPPPTEFSWYGRAANPQWIRGTSLRKEPPNLPPKLIYDPKTNQIFVK